MRLFEAVKKGVSIIEAAERYGLSVNKHNRCICPFHDDHNPSMKLFEDTNTFYCFTCHASGSVIDLIAQFMGTDAKAAAMMLAKDFCIQYEGDSGNYIPQKPKPRPEKQYDAEMLHFTRVAVTYLVKLEKWLKFAPKAPEEEPCCLWLEAIENYDQVNEIVRTLLYGNALERAEIIIGLKEDLKRYEKRIREFAS